MSTSSPLPFAEAYRLSGSAGQEAQQQLLIRELNHRVKNVLALVQSIARRTARHTGSVNEFLDAFDGRLQAMSAAHALLSDSWWRGAV